METSMNLPNDSVSSDFLAELSNLRRHWVWFLALGIAMVVLGTFAIGWAYAVNITVAATWLFGFFLLGTGVVEVINSFWVGRWSGMLLHIVIGLLYAVVGVMVIDQPVNAAVQLTLLIAIFLIITGLMRVVFAIMQDIPARGWILLNGAVTFFLGMLIYKQWPDSGLWVIGLFIGIELIFNGWAWIMLAISLHRHQPISHSNASL
jgi:uncharacterized membrane protein HdeD (DUF308 family)